MKIEKYLKSKYIWIIIIIIVVLFLLEKVMGSKSPANIGKLTDNWIKTVTVDKDPDKIHDLFTSDGILLGTVSKITRRNIDIKKYFDYFAKLPELKVVDKKYDIVKVTDNVFMNIAYITWTWKGQEPITANMVYIFRGDKIFYLNSSTLPEINEELLKISGEK
jgi:hypothetical protein